jgi:hypothetical protein
MQAILVLTETSGGKLYVNVDKIISFRQCYTAEPKYWTELRLDLPKNEKYNIQETPQEICNMLQQIRTPPEQPNRFKVILLEE